MGRVLFASVLFLLNLLFVTAEEAISSSNIVRIKRRADDGYRRAFKLYTIIKKSPDVEIALYIGESITVMVFASYVITWAHGWISLTWPEMLNTSYGGLASFIAVVLFSYISIIVTRLVSHIVVKRNPEKAAYFLIDFVLATMKILSPFVKLFMFSGDSITKRFERNAEQQEKEDYGDEVHVIVNESAEQGNITEDEVEMISNVFEFDDEIVGNIAVHRKDIVALNVDSDVAEIFEVISDQKYSRIPVFEENIDNIIGILHVKDLLQYILLGKNLDELNVREILNKPYFLPISKKTNELFKEMQINKTHMAIVVDEYGGTAGIVTMEDLIEEIMGSILDEYDEEEMPEIEKIDENTYRISGTADLENVEKLLGIPFPVDDYGTLGGFLIGQIGHIPSEEEKPEVEYGEYLFKCDKISDRRIDSILVCKQ